MCNPEYLYHMSEKGLELSSRKDIRPIYKRYLYIISCGIGCILGLSVFLTVSAVYISIDYGEEVKNVVADCKDTVIKFVPLGAYPGGSQHVKAALNYCESLG
jgi:hypothetical protein